MGGIHDIFEAIAKEGFSMSTIRLIDDYAKDIQNGKTNFSGYTIPEHAGLCTAGAALIGASLIASYARASLTASGDAECSQNGPNNWQIDELQEQLIEQWSKAAHLWVENSDEILTSALGPI